MRRATNWVRLVPTARTTVALSTKALFTSLTLSNSGIGETVIRTRGSVSISSDQAAAQENQTGAFGMIVVNDIALALGATGIPGPGTDASDDGWFVWMPFMLQSESFSAGAGGINDRVFTFDSKAARRVEEGFGIAVMLENASPSHGLTAMVTLSMLSKVNT